MFKSIIIGICVLVPVLALAADPKPTSPSTPVAPVPPTMNATQCMQRLRVAADYANDRKNERDQLEVVISQQKVQLNDLQAEISKLHAQKLQVKDKKQ